MYKQLKFYTFIIIASGIWGISGGVIKYLNFPATLISFIRAVFPFIILTTVFLFQKRRLFRKGFYWMVLASILSAARMLLYFCGYAHTTISLAVISLYTWPFFGTMLSAIILKEHISKAQTLLLLTAFAGVIIIYSNQPLSIHNEHLLGISAMVLSGVAYALALIIFKKESQRYDAFESVYFQNLVPTLIFLPFLWQIDFTPSALDLGISAIYAIMAGLVGFGLFFKALQHVPASRAALLSYFEVVSAIFTGVIFYQEPLTLNLIIGGSIIIASTILLRKVNN